MILKGVAQKSPALRRVVFGSDQSWTSTANMFCPEQRSDDIVDVDDLRERLQQHGHRQLQADIVRKSPIDHCGLLGHG